jgi:hypothetical protein
VSSVGEAVSVEIEFDRDNTKGESSDYKVKKKKKHV